MLLTTRRLLLRPFTEADVDDLTRIYADPAVVRYLGDGRPLDRAATWRAVATYLGHTQMRGYGPLAVVERSTGRLLGRSGLWYPEGWPGLEVGWVVDRDRWGEGFATEAARASLDHCFSTLGAAEVISLIQPENVASVRVAEKLGARVERRLHDFLGAPNVDVYVHRPVVTIRSATPEDAAGVAGVHVRSWQVAYRGLLPDDYLDALRPEDRMARYTFGDTRQGAPATLLADEGGSIVGFATTGPSRDADAEGSGELLALYVEPDRWGTGVGRLLMGGARAALVEGGFREAVLWVLAGNERAARFYRTDGWRPDGRRREEVVWGVSVDEVRYRRSLP